MLPPIHWGTFNLAPHAWAEPGEWMADAAGAAGRALSAPVVRRWSPAGDEGAAPVVPAAEGDLDLAGDR